jgi:uncharacterized membrane protein YcaP (DUF421 family)
VPDISFLEKVVRTVAVYAFLVIGLRVAGKREMSQLNSFDLVVLLLLSNTVQNAVIGPDNSLTGGILGGATLLALNALVVRALFSAGKLDALEGKPEVLVRDGRLVRRNLQKELITVAELASAARRQGIDSLASVKECRIETGGALSFVQGHRPRTKTTPRARRAHRRIGVKPTPLARSTRRPRARVRKR